MSSRISKRVTALFLLALALSLIVGITVRGGSAPASAHVTHSAVAATDVEDNDLPRGSYNNHLIHLHPASQILAPTIHFNVTGGGLPTGATLEFYSDFGGRCASNTLDGSSVVVSGDGSFPPQNFSATGCPVGNYLVEAIDPLNRVYTAILTISS